MILLAWLPRKIQTGTAHFHTQGATLNERPPQTGTPELELEQRAFRTKIIYRFFANFVEYTIRDSAGGIASFSVKYTEIPSKVKYSLFQEARRPAVQNQVFLLLFMALLIFAVLRQNSEQILPFLIVAGAVGIGGSALLRRYLRKIYTSIPTVNRKLLVLRDAQHDEVLKELESRRMRALRKLAVIDPLNAPQLELRKFMWLKEEGIISEQECDFFRQKLVDSAKGVGSLVPLSKPPGETIQ